MESSSSSPPSVSSETGAGNLADLIAFSHLRWDFVTQRPQHLLSRAARNRRVFYWEEPVWHRDELDLPRRPDGSLGMYLEIREVVPSLWIVRPHLTWGIDFADGQKTLLAEFMASFLIEKFVLWYYSPMAFAFANHLLSHLTVYDCMDELTAFLGAPSRLAELEEQLLQNVDVVFTGGKSLYESKRHHHHSIHVFPSSIDVEHFADLPSGSRFSDPEDQVAIPSPRAGFYGVIDERFDIGLLASIAHLRPQVHFVIVGPVAKIDPASLPRAANIHYLPAKSYGQLPSYLAGWQVALLPFALNDATRFISPTKTPEYLAAGKPVVSTSIRDIVAGYGNGGLVAIADTPEDFVAAIDRALRPQSASWRKAVDRKLAETSWDSTWAGMQAIMKSVQKDKVSKPLHRALRLASAPRKIATPFAAPAPFNSLVRRRRTETFDYVVVGAGFAGSVLAERLAGHLGKRVLLIDKRDHVGGNAYDFYNQHGILVHKYGPHIFHTNSEKVLRYLSRFTDWRRYEHRVLSSVDNQLLPVPINLDTINRLYSLNLDANGMQAFLAERAIQADVIRTSEDIVLSRVGRELYEKFFRNYTRKQWGLDPSQLDASVAGRIPIRFDRDQRYFSDSYQVMPIDGYTRMFERMLDQPNLTVRTGLEFKGCARLYPDAKIVFTGPIDEYFDYRFGALPYRSLEFRHQTYDRPVFQSAPVINYPNDYEYTRITEFKYLTGQTHAKTSIVYEYPRATGDPYYPIPCPENSEVFTRYQELALLDDRVHFCGRLANYRYFNMDQVVAQALATFSRIVGKDSSLLSAMEGAKVSNLGDSVASTTQSTLGDGLRA